MKMSHPPFPTGTVLFVTMCLRHALPENFTQNLGIQFYTAQTRLAAHPDRLNLLHQVRKRLFARYDEALDLEKYQPGYFREPLMAQTLADALQHQNESELDCLAYSILPNHVHFMIVLPGSDSSMTYTPEFHSMTGQVRNWVLQIQTATEIPLKKALRDIGFRSHENIFQIQNSQGLARQEGPCWEAKSFDFLIRDAREYDHALQYIGLNPAKAGLSDWPYTYYKK